MKGETISMALLSGVKLLPVIRAGVETRDVDKLDGERASIDTGHKGDHKAITELTGPVRVEDSRNRRKGVGGLEVAGGDTKFVLVDVDNILGLLAIFVPHGVPCQHM